MTTVQTRPSSAIDAMFARRKHFADILPDHVDVKAFLGTAAAALYADPKLMAAAEANPESFVTTLMECASLGHQPGSDEYYLTWRKIKQRPTVMGIEGYRGIIERMYRSGAVANVIVREVCKNDDFEYVEGVHTKPIHSVDWFSEDDRGPMIGVYAYAQLTSGATSRVVLLNRADVMRSKEASDGADSEYSPWNKHERAMWWKTAVRRLEPWLPASSEYRMTEARATAQAIQATQVPAPPGDAIPVGGNTHAALPAGKPADPEIADAIGQQIGMEFDKLGLVDVEERAVWVNKLAGKDSDAPVAQLTQDDLMTALRKLEGCETVAELHEATS